MSRKLHRPTRPSTTPTRRRPVGASVSAVVSLAVGVSLTLSMPATATEKPAPDDVAPVPVESTINQHSSDEREPTLSARAAGGGGSAYLTLYERTRPVAPGLEHTRFDRYDARGWVRVNVLTADLSTPGLRLDYASPGKVASTAPLTTALRRDGAVAGVNADFFDIGNTGAPLGVGVDRQRGVLHGSRRGPNHTFSVDTRNAAAIAQTYLKARVVRGNGTELPATNLNAPEVSRDGIGIFTPAWGAASRGRTVPAGTARREVLVVGGRVRSNRRTLSSGPVARGTVLLVGRGDGARRLSGFKRGQRVAVTYGLNMPATRVAVGGNVRLLRNGSFTNLNDVELHPRTAIGIDRDEGTIIIVTADGRQSHSRGLTMQETAQMMRRLGAEDALNLDGGGSSTMVARESGEAAGVVNAPSDGRLRSVPNGLGFAMTEGSGRLRGIRIEPAADMLDSHRVLSGLSRVLVARGHDETHDPVSARPSWSGTNGVTTGSGASARTVAVGRRPGTGTVTAASGPASGEYRLRVLGSVHRLETTVPSIALSGRSASRGFEVRGYDARGFGTWVEPRDVRLSYDRDKLAVRRTGRGFTVKALVASTSDVVRVAAGGRATHIGVTVGLASTVVDRMDGLDGWGASSYPAKADARLSRTTDRRGRAGRAIAMRYSLLGSTRVRAAYLDAKPQRGLPTRARRLGLWVRGDGKGAWLRATVRDKGGARASVDLSSRVTWRGWRFVSAALPGGLLQPLRVVRVYAVETTRSRKYSGTLAFDDLTVMTERVAAVPVTAPLRDAMVADQGAMGASPVEVAVLAGSRISASSPNGSAVARLRRAMREAVASRPDLVLLNGDIVRRGGRTDLALARRVVTDELEGKVAWRYVPGEGEIGPSGNLSAFRQEFGDPVRVVNHRGTRFVLLNSAPGSFRLAGFTQLTRLSSELDAAAADPAVGSVVVVAHHPTSDPVAGGTAEIIDPREGELVEDLLARFRGTSGKPAAYVAAHGRRFGLTRHDDVPQLAAGPVSDPVRGGTGSFAGWSRFRVDVSADPWLRTEMRPFVDTLRIAAPGTLARGASVDAWASLTQLGRLRRVAYPMNAVWVPSPTTHIGPPGTASTVAVVAYNPTTGRLTGLRRGSTDLVVRVNGTTVRRTVTVD